MTQFRPGQRVRVVNGAEWGAGSEGVVIGIHPDGGVALQVGEDGSIWFDPAELTLIPLPGIPAHLVRAPATDACRHLPVWTR